MAMDPLSITASVIAIIQLTGTVVSYLNDVKDAPKDCKDIKVEAANLYSLLIQLQCRLEQDDLNLPWYATMQSLAVFGGPLDQYLEALKQLESKVVVNGGARKVRGALLWTFSKKAVAKILNRMERLKSLLAVALEMDHL
jgi:hypothetical protein